MPKFPTFPTLYDEILQIHLSKLKAWGWLAPGQFNSGTITWSSNGIKTGSISIQVNTFDKQHAFIKLDYKYGGEPRKYKVHLVSAPSNLGKGEVWYFLCPRTGKRCRKLYSVGGYFLHREAFDGCMYDSQTKSKQWRQIEKVYGCYFDQDKYYEELRRKHFKRTYAGKPTKRYLRIAERIERAKRIPYREIELLMAGILKVPAGSI